MIHPPIYVPFTRLYPRAAFALASWNPTYVPMYADRSYLDYWETRWEECREFINAEHDVVPDEQSIPSLLACPRPWCFFGYDPHKFPFGLVRMKAEVITRLPEVWSTLEKRMVEITPSLQWHGWPLWSFLDSWFVEYAKEQEVYPHRHFPDVVNLAQPRSYID